MGTDLASLVDRDRLQGIVDALLRSNPLKCPPIENQKWHSLTGQIVAATGDIGQLELNNALDPEALVQQKMVELLSEFREEVVTRAENCRRTLMMTLHLPTLSVELHEPMMIWRMVLRWEVDFDPHPADNVLPVNWITD